jgi:hypothetical protein
MQKIIKIILIFYLVLSGCTFKSKRLIITKLSPIESTEKLDSSSYHLYKFYVVRNFKFGNIEDFKQLKDFAFSTVEPRIYQYSLYVVTFYKESKKTPLEFKETESDLLLWHDQDLIYTFVWVKGKFGYFTAYKNGKPLN